MVLGNVSGSVATLVVGILELLDTLVDLGLYIGEIIQNSSKFLESRWYIGRIILFGVYIVFAFAATILLIYSTFAKSLYIRKIICVGWISFRVFCFTITIIVLVAGKWWEDKTLLAMAIVSMVMWIIFVGIVSYYTHKLIKALHNKRCAAKKEKTKRQINVVAQHPPAKLQLTPPTKSQPWSKSQFQVIRNEHVFSTKRQY